MLAAATAGGEPARVPLSEHALAVMLVLASIYGLVRLYVFGLLHGGSRLGAHDAGRLTRRP